MRYPPEMSAQDIMEFEFELNRIRDMEERVGAYWAVNAECQIVAESAAD